MTCSQTVWLRTQLIAGRRITPLQALKEAGIFRLAARCAELRELGMPIRTTMVTRGNKRVAEYSRG
jgi:hypothetical protein